MSPNTLIIQGAEVNKGDDSWTALHNAASFGHLDVTKYLISQGAEVHMGDNEGATALQLGGSSNDISEYS